MNQNNNKSKCWVKELICNHWFIVGILIVLIVIDICIHISEIVVVKESIVLTFIGILATFVVISNYAQLKDIKYETKSEISKLNSRLKELENYTGGTSLYQFRMDIYKKFIIMYKKLELSNNLDRNKQKEYLNIILDAIINAGLLNDSMEIERLIKDGIIDYFSTLEDNNLMILDDSGYIDINSKINRALEIYVLPLGVTKKLSEEDRKKFFNILNLIRGLKTI
ncbi:hypothetical protein FACS1894153_4350 [Bacteroidia bacterium]|nr:hypothetical protein FACS1894153_4350 [Bacteroidia bacterium]